MTIIKSLGNTSFDQIFDAFKAAFKDYEMQLNNTELRVMLTRRGFVPELSFAAFYGDKICSFTLNGIGRFNGIKTAYDTGTGTLEEYRGKGLASKIFAYSIPFLKDEGVSQYLLEVLQHNPAAVSVYKKAGFQVSREFNYFEESVDHIEIKPKSFGAEYQIKPIEFPNEKEVAPFMDFPHSWQNSFEAIKRAPETFVAFGAFANYQLVGYCIFDPNSGDLTQLAVHPDHRRKGIASALFEQALKINRHQSVKAINTEIGCHSITQFLNSHGLTVLGKQFEMIRQL